MATLIGDFGGADHSPFHSRALSSGIAIQQQPPQHQHHQPTAQQLPSTGQPRPHLPDQMQCPTQPTTHNTATSAARPASPPLSSSNSFSQGQATPITTPGHKDADVGGASRILTPPDSSSPSKPGSDSTYRSPQTGDGCLAHMAPTDADTAQAASDSSSASTADTVVPTPSAARPPPPTNAIPSPASDADARWTPGAAGLPLPVASSSPPLASPERVQKTIMIRDLNHIQSLAQVDASTGNGLGILGDTPPQDVKFEISAMPISDIIEMVAALLTKITTTNDHQHDALNRNASQQRQAQAHNDGSDVHASPFSASVLAFHGKNIPAITILSYLSRIHKYCPTTYEVFLSLLVYFDRMAERVNNLVMKQQREGETQSRKDQPQDKQSGAGGQETGAETDVVMGDAENDNSSGGTDETDEGLADSDDDDEDVDDGDDDAGGSSRTNQSGADVGIQPGVAALDIGSLSATYFVVDSYNIHRLIIAGVTCASKFFSDVFYTNSRYAKVGGLPLAELNHLELQFLILNDFRLAIPIEDLEAYATMLVEFYVREVVGQRPRPSSAS